MEAISPSLFLKRYVDMRWVFIFLTGFLPLLVSGQTITISGNAEFFAGEPIEAFVYEDRLTNNERVLATELIDDDGLYSIQIEVDKPQEIGIQIELRKVSFYLHPGTSVRIDFLPIKVAENQRYPLKFKVSYLTLPPHIAKDSVYRDFNSRLANLQSGLSARSNLKKVYNTFYSELDSVYHNYLQNDSLFHVFYTYSKANSYVLTDVSKTTLIYNYLINHPVRYHSKEYIRFFKAVMNPRVNRVFVKNHVEFDRALNEFQVYKSLLEVLQSDSVFENDELRNLALLQYVNSASSNTLLDRDQKMAIIGQMANFSPYPIQQKAARYLQKKKKTLQVNTEAPIFELEDRSGKMLSLQSFRGRPVYLGFINSKSRSCYQDLLVMEKQQKKYKKIQFLLVFTDRDSVDMSNFPHESNNLKYLYLNKNFTVLERYEIWNYPVYFLLDKHGYFLQSPASRPAEMYEKYEEMFARKRGRKGYEIIKD